MVMRTFKDEVLPQLLGQALSGSYTQVFEEKHSEAERVVFLLIGHASVNVAFTVTAATNAAGSDPTDLTTAITCDDAGAMWTIEVDAGDLPAGKDFISPKVTLTGGTYTLLEIKRGLRNQGNLASRHDATYKASESKNLLGGAGIS